MDRPVDLVRLVGAAVVVALVGAMVHVALDARGGARQPAADPVEALVMAWESSRTGTYRASGTFRREAPDGRSLSAEVVIVQRPPDRLLRQFGEVAGRRDDRVLQCPAPIGGAALDCSLGPRGDSFDAVVATEVASFRALLSGDDPLYEVARRSEECWRMTRTRNDPRSGFGVQTDLCIDPDTGAVRSIEIDHGGISERTTYDEIVADVSDADLEP